MFPTGRLADVRDRSAQLAAELAELASPRHDTTDAPAQLCATYLRAFRRRRASHRVCASITPGLPLDAVERVLPAVERAELAGADPTGLCCRAGLGALSEKDLLRQITNQTYSARPQAAYAGILSPPAPSADPAISEQLQSIGCQLEAWREELAERLDSGEPPPNGQHHLAAPSGPGHPNRLGHPCRPSRRLARSAFPRRRRPLRPRTRPLPLRDRCPSQGSRSGTSRATSHGYPAAVAVTSTSRSTAAPEPHPNRSQPPAVPLRP